MPHQDQSQKCYLDLGINLEWPNGVCIITQVSNVQRSHRHI